MKKEYHTILDYISTLVTWLYVTSLVEFIGTLNDGTPFPLASHITPIRNPGMGWNGCPSFRVLKKSYRFWAANSKWSPMRFCNGDTLANCCHFSLPTTQVAPNWAVAMFWDNLRYSHLPCLWWWPPVHALGGKMITKFKKNPLQQDSLSDLLLKLLTCQWLVALTCSQHSAIFCKPWPIVFSLWDDRAGESWRFKLHFRIFHRLYLYLQATVAARDSPLEGDLPCENLMSKRCRTVSNHQVKDISLKKILTSVKQLLESVGSKNLRLTCSRKGREGVPPLWAISPSVMIIMDFGQCPNFYRRITEKWLTPDATIRYVFLQFQEFSDLLVGCGIGHLYLIVLIQIQLTKSAILLWDHKSFRLFRLPRRFGLGSGMVGNTLDCACKLRSTARQELMALS